MIEKAVERLKETRFLLVLTGAGISQESGVPTFRGKDGLWEQYRVEELATPYAFERDPVTVWRWYDWRRGIISRCEPNEAHYAIKRLSSLFTPNFFLITQNVDGLHGRTGIEQMIEIHGNLWRVRCTRDGRTCMLLDVPLKAIPPRCSCGSILRPDVVWFGEPLPYDLLEKAYELLGRADTVLVVGTSGVVQPVASFPFIAKRNGAYIIEVNLESTPITEIADVSLFGKAGEILPRIVAPLTKDD
jgi:NAD-dependent deacetylase